MTAVLVLCMGIGPLLLYAISALGPLLIEDLALSNAEFGALATVAFVVAAIGAAGLGGFVDRARDHWSVAGIFAASALALGTAVLAGSYLWLLFAVAFSGLAQSLSNPVSNRLVAAHIPATRRGLVVGVKQSGVQLSQLFAGLLLPSVALVMGWRGAVGVAITIALLGVVLAVRLVPDSTDTAPSGEPPHGASHGVGAVPAGVWWLAGYALFSGAALQATNVYLPLFAHQEIGLGVVLAGLTGAAAGTIGMVARVLWGRAVNTRTARPHGVLTVLAILSTLSTGLLLGAAHTGEALLLWGGVVGHGVSALAANVVLMLALMGAVHTERVGTATARLSVGLYLGFATGPLTLGLVMDIGDSYALGWLSVGLAHLCALLLTLLWWAASRRAPATHPPPPVRTSSTP
ncbi:MFS transporter [Spiractinospora alimapuensis]|uniref:MFS transporter n=1 Tax=Spiractinospora alimapuensis TaxID=2820884 RepID=UPI001F2334CF|nr:MFS transporter [Spiractinospora alimapuensis]QVQ53425.1 MFS transporter [Spiractinospora alimapuensis]